MSILVIMIPSRSRLCARDDESNESASSSREGYCYALSADGLTIASQGQARVGLLPRADSVVAVLADSDVGWQRLNLPKAPAARLRAALGGLLEENLLEDDETLHLAVSPDATPGQLAWIAVMNKAWLRTELATLETAGLNVERVLPSSWPGDASQGHFFEAGLEEGRTGRIMLCYADEHGHSLLRLDGSLARALLPQMAAQPTRWTATPATAAPAERWIGSSVAVLTDTERALQATRSLWNLRQFDLAPRHRGTRALREAIRRVLSPAWRPVRVGLATFLLLQIAGLNAWAWHQRQAIQQRQSAQEALVRGSFPGVRAILDAPLQMRREVDLLRAAAGRPSVDDLESMLTAAATAWPDGQGPVHTVRFEPGRLTLSTTGWTDDQMARFRDRLESGGWLVENADGRVKISRGSSLGGRS